MELRQYARDYGKRGVAPTGGVGQTLLIMPGTHGKLDNIDGEGRSVKDGVFEHDNKRIERTAMSSARGLMGAWVELRKRQRSTQSSSKDERNG